MGEGFVIFGIMFALMIAGDSLEKRFIKSNVGEILKGIFYFIALALALWFFVIPFASGIFSSDFKGPECIDASAPTAYCEYK